MSKVFVGGMYVGKELVKGGGIIDGEIVGVERLRDVLSNDDLKVDDYVVEDEELDLSLMYLTNELTARKLTGRKKALRLLNKKGGRR